MKKQYVFNAVSQFYCDSFKTVKTGLLGLVASLLLVFTTSVQASTESAETNNWDDAAAAYHSRTPKFSDKYKARFQRILAHLPDQAAMPVRVVKKVKPLMRTTSVFRENNFPLLQPSSSAGKMGSLVPLGSRSSRSLLSNGG